jgi:outer membrane biosynthesis protein TonB
MKSQLQQFLDDLTEFSADLKSICNRQTAHDALLDRWEHIRHDSYRKVPLALTIATHLTVLILTITAPFLMSRSLEIPEVYSVNLYQVMEAPSPAPTIKPVSLTKPATKKAITSKAAKPVKPDAISLSPIRQRLIKERQEKKVKRLNEELRLRNMAQVKAELQEQQAAKEAREAASKALSRLTDLLKSTTASRGSEAQNTQATTTGPATGSGEADPRKLEALAQYKARLSQHIYPHWQLPELQDWDEDLRAVIVLRVKRDGTVTSSYFEKRSGNLRFNQYVQKAIDNAQPLPPFPIDFHEKTEEIAVTFYPGGLM